MYGPLAMTAAGPLMSSWAGGMGANPYYYGGGFNRFRYGYGPNYGLGGGMYGGYGGAAWMNPSYLMGSYW
jgi:hypothetical protein